MSGLRPSPAIRAARLERQAEERELKAGGGLTAPELLWERAVAMAPAEEVSKLHRLCDLSRTLPPETPELLEVLLRIWELRETIQYRASGTLAVVFREARDLPLRGLRQAEADATAAERRGPTGGRRIGGRAETLVQLCIDRAYAIRYRGLEPLSDVARGAAALVEVLEAVDAGDVGRALELVTHHDPGEALLASPETQTKGETP